MSTDDVSLRHGDYTVAWICPLEVEQIAAIAMLDREHQRLPQPPNDHNVYTLGSIHGHNVVIAGLHSPGNNPAAVVVTQMRNTFKHLRFGLLVGIGGGVPTKTERGHIRLGNVVVSKPVGEHSGVVQYDHGKAEVGQFRRTGCLAPPPAVLLNAAREMDVRRAMAQEDPLTQHIARIDTKIPGLKRYKYPGLDKDQLFRAEYVHPDPRVSCRKCGCDLDQIVDRRLLDSDDDDSNDDDDHEYDQRLVVHRGTIAAGELVIKNGMLRDELARQYGILCFEMEAAGAIADFPCLVIRGISDYSDSHKNDRWHGYAAATATAYARELFFHMPVDEVRQCQIPEQDVKQMISKVEALEENDHHCGIRDWLNAPDPSTNLNEAKKKRHGETGSWFLQKSAPFSEWKSGTRRCLWLHGIPGCGKTVLSATIIQHLQQTSPSDTIIYFFFDFNNSDKQSLENLVISLIMQLYSISECSRHELDTLFLSCNKGSRQPASESLVTVFMQMINHLERVKIVIDALDECQTRQELLSWMENLERSGPKGLQLLATSRKEEHIKVGFERWLHGDHYIPLQKDAVNSDIGAYVHEQLRTDRGFERWHSNPHVKKKIEDGITGKADGMFRWAACQLERLKGCLHEEAVEETLDSLPKTLDETYAMILRSIGEDYRPMAIQILQFLTYARPLTVWEAVDVLAVDLSKTPQFSRRRRLQVPTDILHICPSLVTLVTSTDEKSTRSVLQLAHFSVKEYLTSGRLDVAFKKGLDQVNARGCITRICLAYIANLEEPHPGDRDRLEFQDRFPLSRYSVDFWMEHARHSETEKEVQESILDFFLEHEREYAIWDQLFRIRLGWNPTIMPPLHYASFAGLQHVVQRLLNREADVNAQGGELGSSVQAASLGGHKEILQMLLNAGADVNIHDGLFGSSVQAAAFNGNKEILQTLLDAGADVNIEGGFYGSSVQAATTYGNKEILQILLDAGADVNIQGGFYGSSVQAATTYGYKEILQMLLDEGADVNIQGGLYSSSAHAAATYGNKEILQMLLDAGANPSIQDGRFGSGVRMATRRGNKETLQMLLDAAAVANIPVVNIPYMRIDKNDQTTDKDDPKNYVRLF